MKYFTTVAFTLFIISGSLFAQGWKAFVESGGSNTAVPFCDAVQNGIVQLTPANLTEYWTRFLLEDTFYVRNDFAIEVRWKNAKSDGGIESFDTGLYLEGCGIDAGATLMGELSAIQFNSIYAGAALAFERPELVLDFSDWSVVSFVFKNNVLYAAQNGNVFYTLPYAGEITFIESLLLRFKGAGQLDYIKLYDGSAQLIWQEDFTDCNLLATAPGWEQNFVLQVSNDTLVCSGESVNLQANQLEGAVYNWTGPNGFTADQRIASLSGINPSDTGYYYLTADIKGCLTLQDSVHIGLIPVDAPIPGFLGNDTTLCLGTTFRVGRAYPCATYRWQDGSTSANFTIANGGSYWVEIDIDGSKYRDSIRIDYYALPNINLGNDTTLCPGDTLLLDAFLPTAASYQWQDNSNGSTFVVQTSGTYEVVLTDVCGNQASDEIDVTYFNVLQTINLGNDTTLCPGELLLLDATDPAAISYRWQDGSMQPTFQADEPGVYAVTLQDNCNHILTDTIQLQYFEVIQSVSLGKDTTLCPGEVLLLDVTNSAIARYTWQDGSMNSTFAVQSPGTYTINVEDNCGNTATDTIQVQYFEVLQPINLGNDTTLCPGSSLLLDARDVAAITYIWQDGTTNSQLEANQAGIYTVTLEDNCGNKRSDDIEVAYFETIESIELGNDTILCKGETLLLDANDPIIISYRWQDNSTAPTFRVDREGLYTLTVQDRCGNLASDALVVQYEEIPFANIGTDTTACQGNVFRIDATAFNASYYIWQDGWGEAIYPAQETGSYAVEVGNQCGANTYTVFVEFLDCGPCKIGIPSAFSPNDDGVNDLLSVFSNCNFVKFEWRIFSRWGTLLFNTQNPQDTWDGKFQGAVLQPGVYIWALTYESDDGSATTLYGDVAIIR